MVQPPNSSNEVFSSLENRIGRLDSENVEFYLMGDMNCNMALMSDTNSHLLSGITDLYRSFKNFSRDCFRSDIASENWDA